MIYSILRTACKTGTAMNFISTFVPHSQLTSLCSTLQFRHYVGGPHPRKPSRMILSRNVARPPMLSRKVNKRIVEGPFGGMNQTLARLPAKEARAERKEQREARPRYLRNDKPWDNRKALKMQQSLASISYSERSQLKDKMSRYESFDQFGLLPEVKKAVLEDALKGLVDIKPTPVQRLAIPAILGQNKVKTRREYLLAAETGSGKTLAYLTPAINALKVAEKEDPHVAEYWKRQRAAMTETKDSANPTEAFDEPHPYMARPRVIILVPTAELVEQVYKTAKSLIYHAKFKVEKMHSSMSPSAMHRDLYSHRGVDVIISTPHLLSSIAQNDPNILARVTDLVIDEADSLFDRSFMYTTTSIVEKALPSVKRLVVCSATIPRRLDNYLATHYPDMIRITTPNLHAIPRRIQLGVIDVSKDPYRNNKDIACADAIYSIGRDAMKHEDRSIGEGKVAVQRILVFVNEREKTEELAIYLKEKGVDAVALNRDTEEKRLQQVAMEEFTSRNLVITETKTHIKAGKHLPNVRVLVATDLMSRGIDTLAVRYVILYDVPHTTIDFIHRLGRAGRMGKRGRGIILVGNDDRRDVVAEVKNSMFMGKALI